MQSCFWMIYSELFGNVQYLGYANNYIGKK